MKIPLVLLFLGALAVAPLSAAPAPTPDTAVTDFFHYLLSPKHDIVKDSAAQKRWLTRDVRTALAAADAASTKAAKAHPNEEIDGPTNGTFLAAWDPPTSFQVVSVKSTPPTASVDLRFTWGPKTQYPGETRLMTAHLVLEEGAWRVSDIHSHATKFNPESTLLADLRKLASQR
jgi:hypothetical protein